MLFSHVGLMLFQPNIYRMNVLGYEKHATQHG